MAIVFAKSTRKVRAAFSLATRRLVGLCLGVCEGGRAIAVARDLFEVVGG